MNSTTKDTEPDLTHQLDSNDTSSPFFTLGEYEIEEVSLGKAAKLLRKSNRRRSRTHSVTHVGSEEKKATNSAPNPVPFGHQDRRYEVEEIEPDVLATWIPDNVSTDQDEGED